MDGPSKRVDRRVESVSPEKESTGTQRVGLEHSGPQTWLRKSPEGAKQQVQHVTRANRKRVYRAEGRTRMKGPTIQSVQACEQEQTKRGQTMFNHKQGLRRVGGVVSNDTNFFDTGCPFSDPLLNVTKLLRVKWTPFAANQLNLSKPKAPDAWDSGIDSSERGETEAEPRVQQKDGSCQRQSQGPRHCLDKQNTPKPWGDAGPDE